MLIQSHPDFLILPSSRPFGGEKARDGTEAGSAEALGFSGVGTGLCPVQARRSPASTRLMPEMPDPGEDHSQAQPVRRFDDLLIAHRTSGLNNRGGPRLSYLLDAVRKRKKSIGGSHRTLQRQLRLHGAHLA